MTDTPAGDPSAAHPPPAVAAEAAAGGTGEGETSDAEEVVDEPALSLPGDVDAGEPRLSRARDIDRTRAQITWAFIWIFAGTIAAVLLIVAVANPHQSSEAIDVLKTLLPAETAVLGSAVGFYFGTRERP
jgi:hypothetical protein